MCIILLKYRHSAIAQVLRLWIPLLIMEIDPLFSLVHSKVIRGKFSDIFSMMTLNFDAKTPRQREEIYDGGNNIKD